MRLEEAGCRMLIAEDLDVTSVRHHARRFRNSCRLCGLRFAESFDDDHAFQHVHAAGERHVTRLRWCELDDDRLVQRQRPFDVQ